MSGTCYECAGKHPSVAVQAICPAAECLADDLMNEVAAVRVLRKNNQMLTRRLDRYAFDVRRSGCIKPLVGESASACFACLDSCPVGTFVALSSMRIVVYAQWWI